MLSTPRGVRSSEGSPRIVTALLIAFAASTPGVCASGELPGEGTTETEAPMTETSAHTNRLAGESSPYLLLHRHNPVDWYPWGEEALERARREGKPIFLSVGYSTCYWCHVMERESFSDPEIAALMNRHFINIKVDREERPDLDEIYMTATQLLTGHGGWPNSVFLTPDLKPFYAGTYFPPRDRQGMPGFSTLLLSLADAWKNRRSEVEQHAEELAGALKRYLEERSPPGEAPPSPEVARRSFERLASRFDAEWGGFGGAPKFPTPSNLYLLQEIAPENDQAAGMLSATLDHMARGGIYDQLAGGFHRYATDREWKVPHFEKMLYDNGLLLEIYSREHRRTGEPEWARIARETADFLVREMSGEEGGFHSAIDAETDGHEGAYYVWKREELEAALSSEDAVFLAPLLGFGGAPFFEGDHYVLHLPEPLAAQAERRRMSYGELLAEVEPMRERLLAARSQRQRPLTDDKVLADWNGMAIAGMAAAGEALGEEAYVQRAARAAGFILESMRPEGGPLLHAWRAGQGKIPAYLDDYAFLVRGLLALHRATGEEAWLTAARDLTGEQIERLEDPEDGGFFVAAERPDLLFRSKDVLDGATPAANAVAVLNLLRLAELTGDRSYLRRAGRTLAAFAPLAEQYPEGARMLALAARRYAAAAGPVDQAEGKPGASAAPSPAGSASPASEAQDLVAVHVEVGDDQDGWRPLVLTLEVAEGWHVNANPASDDFLIPTSLEPGEGTELQDLDYPQGHRVTLGFAENELSVYDGTVRIRASVSGPGPLRLTYQSCDATRCLPPVTRTIPLD